MSRKKALILGATGLVGKHLTEILIHNPNFEIIRILTRRPLEIEHPQLEQHLVEFDRLESYRKLLEVDQVYCCLGTTIKQARTKKNFRKVDYEYPMQAAKIALEQGATQFLVVTSMGSNPRSLFFYQRVKGELERSLHELGYPMLHIFRPSLLLGDREEFRLGEQTLEFASRFTSFLFRGNLRKYHYIEGKKVAQAMAKVAELERIGTHIYLSDTIERIANEDEIPF